MDPRIDLRSDTVSQPSDPMRQAMAAAPVGDDWYGDNPTVNRLQDRAAELDRQGSGDLPADRHHVQSGGVARLRPVRSFRGVRGERARGQDRGALRRSAGGDRLAGSRGGGLAGGLLTADQVAAALQPDPYDVCVVDLVTIENTHQVGGGSVLATADPKPTSAPPVRQAGVPLYLDGARIFNACAVPVFWCSRVRRARDRDDVLPVEGPWRADRLDAGR